MRDDNHESEHLKVYHDDETDTPPYDMTVLREMWAGKPPRMFVLVGEDWDEEDENSESTPKIVGYGLALPNGRTASFGPNLNFNHPGGTPERAAEFFNAELVWLSPAQ